jgi:hypothetical protein
MVCMISRLHVYNLQGRTRGRGERASERAGGREECRERTNEGSGGKALSAHSIYPIYPIEGEDRAMTGERDRVERRGRGVGCWVTCPDSHRPDIRAPQRPHFG